MDSGQVVESDLPSSEDGVVEPIQFQPVGVGSEKNAFPHLFADLCVLYSKGLIYIRFSEIASVTGRHVRPPNLLPGRMFHFAKKIRNVSLLVLKVAKPFLGSWKMDDKW